MTEHQAVYTTDHFKRSAANLVKSFRGGENKRWLSAFYAAQIVGRYEKGATKEIANKLAVKEDTIEKLARAYIIYHGLRVATRHLGLGVECFRVVSELREQLTYSHFAEAGRLMVAHDLTSLDVFAMLQAAAECRTPVARMAELVDSENGNKNSTTWEGQARQVYTRLLNIATNGAAPTWLARLATDWADALKAAVRKNAKMEL